MDSGQVSSARWVPAQNFWQGCGTLHSLQLMRRRRQQDHSRNSPCPSPGDACAPDAIAGPAQHQVHDMGMRVDSPRRGGGGYSLGGRGFARDDAQGPCGEWGPRHVVHVSNSGAPPDSEDQCEALEQMHCNCKPVRNRKAVCRYAAETSAFSCSVPALCAVQAPHVWRIDGRVTCLTRTAAVEGLS